jgi:hypothetical protein
MSSLERRGAGAGSRREQRSHRVVGRVAHLSSKVEGGFYEELRSRWPVVPTLASPLSQLCTSSQFAESHYARICSLLSVSPRLQRKQWEFVYIVRCIEKAGLIATGMRGLAFGVGREKLPALFVSEGCDIVATDLPSGEGDGHWAGGPQHTDSLEGLFHSGIVDRKAFQAHASFRPVNMNAIPGDLLDFDFCWSSCALEHLGSLEHGLAFIRNSLKCLKPGGVAVHTTEFNLDSDSKTLVDGPSVVYRERDLVEFADEMQRQGYTMALNLNPGGEPTDYLIDRDRNSDIHLRLYVRHQVLATSVGLCIRKAN